jgi:hypothetical protein
MPDEMALLYQSAEMVLQRVAAGAAGTDHVGNVARPCWRTSSMIWMVSSGTHGTKEFWRKGSQRAPWVFGMSPVSNFQLYPHMHTHKHP